jgi:hypothetical protein
MLLFYGDVVVPNVDDVMIIIIMIVAFVKSDYWLRFSWWLPISRRVVQNNRAIRVVWFINIRKPDDERKPKQKGVGRIFRGVSPPKDFFRQKKGSRVINDEFAANRVTKWMKLSNEVAAKRKERCNTFHCQGLPFSAGTQ